MEGNNAEGLDLLDTVVASLVGEEEGVTVQKKIPGRATPILPVMKITHTHQITLRETDNVVKVRDKPDQEEIHPKNHPRKITLNPLTTLTAH